MTIKVELTERVVRLISYNSGKSSREIADEIVEEWYDSRAEWLDKLIQRAEGDVDFMAFLAEKYPDGDEERDD